MRTEASGEHSRDRRAPAPARWEPMRLTALGRVGELIGGMVGSRNEPGTGNRGKRFKG